MKRIGLFIFMYAFLGATVVAGCTLGSIYLHKKPLAIITEEKPLESPDDSVDCEEMHEMIENLSPSICAPWKDGTDFNRQQRGRKNLFRAYKKHCRLL